VPKPWVNLTRFQGVIAANSTHRARVAPAKQSNVNKASVTEATAGCFGLQQLKYDCSTGTTGVAASEIFAGTPCCVAAVNVMTAATET